MKYYKFSDIFDIKSGYNIRETLSFNNTESVFAITPKNILTNTEPIQKIQIKIAKNITILKNNDILLTNRGSFKSKIFNTKNFNVDINNKAVAVSSIFVLRLNKNNNFLLPEYISLWLNSEKGQLALQQIQSPGTIKAVIMADLKDIKIHIPATEKQIQLINLVNTVNNYNKLTKKLNDLYLQIINNEINSIGDNYNGIYTR